MRIHTTLLLIVAAASVSAAQAEHCIWTAGSFTDGDPTNNNYHWENPANWSCGHAPGSDDIATIMIDDAVVLSTSRTVQSLNLWGGNLTLVDDHTLTVGQLNWTTGFMGGGIVVVQDLLTLSGPAPKQLVTGVAGAMLRLDGAGTWEGGDLSLEGAVTFHINGTFSVGTDADVRMLGDGAEIVNAGTLQKTGGSGATDLLAPVRNTGTLRAQTGALRLRAGGTLTGGTYTAAAGASLLFTAGTFRAFGTLYGDPLGVVGLESDEGAPHVRPLFEGVGARLDVGGGGLVWRDGTFAGTWTNVDTIQLVTGTYRSVVGSFRNERTVYLRGGDLRCVGTLENAPAATFRLLDDSDVTRIISGRFVNYGFVRKAGGAELSDFQDPASNDGDFVENHSGGVLVVESGTLAFSGGLYHREGAEVRGTATFAPDSPYNLRSGGRGAGPSRSAGDLFLGDVSPGPYGGGTGVLTWSGNYRPTGASTLTIDLGGPEPGQYDQIAVDGITAEIDGALALRLVNGYVPAVGQSFTVMTAPLIGGLFDAVNAPPGYAFDVDYDPTSVVVTVTATPPVAVAIEPESPPVVVPAGGGPVTYRVTLTNATAQQQTFEAWTEAVLPGGGVRSPVEGPVTLRLNAGQTLGPLALQLTVPGAAPAGPYTYRLRVGLYPNQVIAEAGFTFEKQGAVLAGGAPWALTGSGFPGVSEIGAAASGAPEAYALHAAAPNPFATQATLRYDLPEASAVRLVVYDLLGREVAVLADGEAEAGPHTAVLDGRGLAAGVYLVQLTAGSHVFTRRVTLVR